MIEVLSSGVLLGIIIGVVQLAKKAGLPSKFAPLLAIGVGLAFSLFNFFVSDLGLKEAVFTGVVFGLSAVGLFSGVKNLVEKE